MSGEKPWTTAAGFSAAVDTGRSPRSRSAIRSQFLGEAALLGAVGGLLGVAAGYGLHVLYRGYTEDLYGGYGEVFSVPVALGALSLALLVSLLFGLYPAVLASRVRIIEALEEA